MGTDGRSVAGGQHGFGTYKYATGKTYTGLWQEDTPHGKGAAHAQARTRRAHTGPLCKGLWLRTEPSGRSGLSIRDRRRPADPSRSKGPAGARPRPRRSVCARRSERPRRSARPCRPACPRCSADESPRPFPRRPPPFSVNAALMANHSHAPPPGKSAFCMSGGRGMACVKKGVLTSCMKRGVAAPVIQNVPIFIFFLPRRQASWWTGP